MPCLASIGTLCMLPRLCSSIICRMQRRVQLFVYPFPFQLWELQLHAAWRPRCQEDRQDLHCGSLGMSKCLARPSVMLILLASWIYILVPPYHAHINQSSSSSLSLLYSEGESGGGEGILFFDDLFFPEEVCDKGVAGWRSGRLL